MAPKSCNACKKYISTTGAASCSICESLFHKTCVAIKESSPVSKAWVCPECTTRTRKGDNTPVRHATNDALLAANSSQSGAYSVNLQDMHHQFAEWMNEIREFRREIAEFRFTINNLSERMDSVETRLEAVEQRREDPPAEVADLRCKIVLLQQELNDRDQDSLLSDLEIGQLPEEKGENVVHTVTVLAAKLGVPLEERDIVFAERVGVAQGAGAGGEAPRARRVVVRLVRRHLRDQLLQSARVRRTLTIADAGRDPCAIAGATAQPRTRIFLNERLTRVNRQLFHKVREECRKLQWRYSWTKRGRVYARQADGKDAFPFRSEEDISRVFGSKPV